MVIPRHRLYYKYRFSRRDLDAGAPIIKLDEDIVQTTNRNGSENYSDMRKNY